jgi:predicted ribosomally synthesized peptide with nif11-like leader
MNEKMEKLSKLASEDKELKTKLQKASKEQIVALAKEHGITLMEADFETPKGKVSDDELEAVAGGGSCVCVMGGGGTKGEGEQTCACVLAGWGNYADGRRRCDCSLYGSGDDIYNN